MANQKPTKGQRLAPVIPRTIEANETTIKVINLRREGKSYDEIAEELGITRKQVDICIGDAVKYWRETKVAIVDEMRQISGLRLEKLIASLWPSAITGDPAAVAEVRKLDESLRKLYGADAPQKIAPVMPDGNSPYFPEIDDRQRARDMDSLFATSPKEETR